MNRSANGIAVRVARLPCVAIISLCVTLTATCALGVLQIIFLDDRVHEADAIVLGRATGAPVRNEMWYCAGYCQDMGKAELVWRRNWQVEIEQIEKDQKRFR